MDPRDRLWAHLIFPHCEPADLLALRAVCRAWLAQLNNSRLWLPITMELPRMRYDERVDGWPGVVRAIARERNTHANCNAGRFTHGPVLDVTDVRTMLYVSGCIAVFCDDVVLLFDADAGTRLATFDVERASCVAYDSAVLDRWIPFAVMDGCALLLDCVAEQLVEMVPADETRGDMAFSVAGPCVSYREYGDTVVTIVHVSGRPNGATVVQQVGACVHLDDYRNAVFLCERGCSYLLHGYAVTTLQLMDVATGQRKRVFTLGVCVHSTAPLPN